MARRTSSIYTIVMFLSFAGFTLQQVEAGKYSSGLPSQPEPSDQLCIALCVDGALFVQASRLTLGTTYQSRKQCAQSSKTR